MKTPQITTLLMIPLFGVIPLVAQSTPHNPTPACSPADGHGRHARKDLANLTDAERQQLKAAMKQIKDDPQLVASREAVKEAQTKEARIVARQEKQKIRHDLLLKADPSLASILPKIHPGKSAE
jgi:Spy/CpxP family protein refolding chaperone